MKSIKIRLFRSIFKQVNNKYYIPLLFIFVVSSCSYWNYYVKAEYEHPNYTTCKLTEFQHVSTGKSRYWIGRYLYEVNGERYKADGYGAGLPKYRILGRHFKIKYDSLHPENAKVLMAEPFFTYDDTIKKTIGLVIYLGKDFINFDYQNENSKSYRNFQFMYKNYKLKYPNLVKGAKYEVE